MPGLHGQTKQGHGQIIWNPTLPMTTGTPLHLAAVQSREQGILGLVGSHKLLVRWLMMVTNCLKGLLSYDSFYCSLLFSLHLLLFALCLDVIRDFIHLASMHPQTTIIILNQNNNSQSRLMLCMLMTTTEFDAYHLYQAQLVIYTGDVLSNKPDKLFQPLEKIGAYFAEKSCKLNVT